MKIAFFEVIYYDDERPHRIITKSLHWHRIVNPALHLKNVTDWEIRIFKNPFQVGSGFKNWDDIFSHFDVCYFPYFSNHKLYTLLLVLAKKYKRKLIVDIDDNLWELTPKHRLYPYFHMGSALFYYYFDLAKTAPYLTTTTKLLKKKLMTISIQKNIQILSNYIDLSMYKRSGKLKYKNLTIVYFGNNNHRQDIVLPSFVKAIIRIIHDYPDVVFKTIGMDRLSLFSKQMGNQYVTVKGTMDYYKFLKLWYDHVSTAHISIAPLEISNFSHGKSPLKFIESGAGKLPFVCSNTAPYREVVQQEKTGFLCKTEEDWYQAFSTLIKNKSLRKKVGENAYEEVKKNWTIQKNIWKYKEFFEKLI